MDNLASLVVTAANTLLPLSERHHAFGVIVTRFQDMVFGCAYARLGEAATAEDVAQETFLIAWRSLPTLRDTNAFPVWLKQIVLRQCSRHTRRQEPQFETLDSSQTLPSPLPTLTTILERQEQAALVRKVIDTLPHSEQAVVVLFYIGDYSRTEVATFLGISTVAVKKRLASARNKLRERLLFMIQDDLKQIRPSNSTAFADKVLGFTRLFSALIDEGVSLVRSLERISAQEEDPVFRSVIDDVNTEIQQGNSLSRAMAKHPTYFDEKYVDAIQQGERAGWLEIVLEQLANGKPISLESVGG